MLWMCYTRPLNIPLYQSCSYAKTAKCVAFHQKLTNSKLFSHDQVTIPCHQQTACTTDFQRAMGILRYWVRYFISWAIMYSNCNTFFVSLHVMLSKGLLNSFLWEHGEGTLESLVLFSANIHKNPRKTLKVISTSGNDMFMMLLSYSGFFWRKRTMDFCVKLHLFPLFFHIQLVKIVPPLQYQRHFPVCFI